MKKISLLLMSVLVIASVGIFTSCEDETTPSTLNIETKIDSSATDFAPGSSVQFTITVTTNKDLESVSVTPSEGQGIPFNDDEIETATTTTDSVSTTILEDAYDIPEDMNDGDKITLTFEATDAETSYQTSTDITVDAKTDLSNENNGIVHHLYGPDQGAYDLVNNEGVSMGGTDNRYLGDKKDMINRAQYDAPNENFLNEFISGNATRFVAANDFDYANATVEAAKETYEAASEKLGAAEQAGKTWSDFKYATANEGDIFIANLRGNNEYAVIKITGVVTDENNNGDIDEDSYIEFTYKKAPSDNTAKSASGKTEMVYY